jgi:murein DD-endopeptidase MepM/ murein hydrolase activator NlpD
VANRYYTVMIVPERSSQVRRLKIAKRWIGYGLLGVAGLFSVASFLFIHYLYVVQETSENRRLKEDNIQLRAQLQLLRDRVDTVSDTLERIERFSVKLKAITQLSDSERSLAIGPLQSGERIDDGPSAKHEVKFARGESDREDEPLDSELSAALLTARLDDQAADARKKEEDIRELQEYFEDQKTLLATTPSIWPTRGWVTSKFGVRTDPYTERNAMHKGLDVAGPVGTAINAPSDGYVIYAAFRKGYGNTIVIDHGFGVQTHFGHLSEFKVKAGERVSRGQPIGSIGNTGRSTGPHLHYEVRIHGIPQNPQKFILD